MIITKAHQQVLIKSLQHGMHIYIVTIPRHLAFHEKLNRVLVKGFLGLYSQINYLEGIFFPFHFRLSFRYKLFFYDGNIADNISLKNPPTTSAFSSFSKDFRSEKNTLPRWEIYLPTDVFHFAVKIFPG